MDENQLLVDGVAKNVDAIKESVESVKSIADKNAETIASDKESTSKELETLKNEAIDSRNEIDNLRKEIEVSKTSEKEVEKGIMDYAEAFKALSKRNGGDASSKLTLKAASNYTPSAGDDSAPGREDRTGHIVYDPFEMSVLSAFRQFHSSNAEAYRLNTLTTTSAAGVRGLGDAMGKTTMAVTDEYISYKDLGHAVTFPIESLEDTAGLKSTADEVLKKQLTTAVNAQVLRGDGTGDNLRGLESWSAPKTATTFETLFGGLADSYGTAANEIDVIVALDSSLRRDNFTGMKKCLVNPEFKASVQGIKATTGEYVLRTAYDPAGNEMSFIAGVMIIESPAVTAGHFHFFDDTAVKFVTRQEMTLETGYDGDDFSRNNITMKAWKRGNVVGELPAGIVNGTFANAFTALNT